MADEQVNTAVPRNGDVDRVQMMSLRADGAPDQTPGFEIIGDKETALAQSAEQFRQQAVSAVDQAERGPSGDAGTVVEDAPQDPTIEALKAKHDEAAEAATKAAEAAVEKLFVEPAPVRSPAGTEQASAKPAPAGKSSSSSTSK
jgi:hypothetical protein